MPVTRSRMARLNTSAVRPHTTASLGSQCCFWMQTCLNFGMVQVSKNKFYECVHKAVASEGRGSTVVHGNCGRRGRVGGSTVDLCCGFFRDWVETYCQVDGGGRLLWPQGVTIKDVFETTFQDWLGSQQPDTGSLSSPSVSLSSFRSALAEPEFAHILMRREHNHTRCDRYTCSNC